MGGGSSQCWSPLGARIMCLQPGAVVKQPLGLVDAFGSMSFPEVRLSFCSEHLLFLSQAWKWSKMIQFLRAAQISAVVNHEPFLLRDARLCLWVPRAPALGLRTKLSYG